MDPQTNSPTLEPESNQSTDSQSTYKPNPRLDRLVKFIVISFFLFILFIGVIIGILILRKSKQTVQQEKKDAISKAILNEIKKSNQKMENNAIYPPYASLSALLGQETRLYKNTSFRVNSIKKYDYFPQDIPIATDSQRIVVNVTIINVGTTELHYSVRWDFQIQDAGGFEEGTINDYPSLKNPLGENTILPGNAVTGDIIYDIPEKDQQATLIYDPFDGASVYVGIPLTIGAESSPSAKLIGIQKEIAFTNDDNSPGLRVSFESNFPATLNPDKELYTLTDDSAKTHHIQYFSTERSGFIPFLKVNAQPQSGASCMLLNDIISVNGNYTFKKVYCYHNSDPNDFAYNPLTSKITHSECVAEIPKGNDNMVLYFYTGNADGHDECNFVKYYLSNLSINPPL